MTFNNKLRRSFFAATIVIALCSHGWTQTVARPESVGMSAERLAILTSTLDQYARNGQLSGGVALVLRRGKVAYKHSFGSRDREASAPMKDTDLSIASQSKAVTSVPL